MAGVVSRAVVTLSSSRRVIVVVPAYEEAAKIQSTLAAMPPVVDVVYVVDDASLDRTVELAHSVGDARVQVLRHSANRGVGAAIVTGYRAALATAGSPDDAFVVMKEKPKEVRVAEVV